MAADDPRALHAISRKPMVLRYAFAFLATLAAVTAQVALTDELTVSVYSILVGAVALAVWYGGFGPGFLSVIVG